MRSNQDDKLATLLGDVDRALPAPDVGQDLAGRVRLLASRRRARRTGLLALAALIAAAIGIGSFGRWNQANEVLDAVTPEPDLVVVRAEIKRLRAEARFRMLLVKSIDSKIRIRQQIALLEKQVSTPLPDPLLDARIGIEQAARTLVTQGDRLMHEMQRPEIARSRYERAIELYPHTASAIEARRQLDEIDHSPTL